MDGVRIGAPLVEIELRAKDFKEYAIKEFERQNDIADQYSRENAALRLEIEQLKSLIKK